MIELIDVEKTYRSRRGGRKTVFSDVNLRLEKGYNYGMLGLNGAGKSTLLRLIAGAERPSSGIINRDVSISWPLGLASSFHGSLSGVENLRFVARIYQADIDEVTDFCAWFSELGKALYHPVKTYSSGMRARLAFGLSMAINFQVYVIDESLSVGDRTFQEKARNEFASRREYSDIILTSHSNELIRQFCDRAGVIAGGRVTLFDTLDEAEDFYARVTA